MAKGAKISSGNKKKEIKSAARHSRLTARSINEKTPDTNLNKNYINMDFTESRRSPEKSNPQSLTTPRSSRKKVVSSPAVSRSGRRRSLFKESQVNTINEENEVHLNGIEPLSPIIQRNLRRVKIVIDKTPFMEKNNNTDKMTQPKNEKSVEKKRISLSLTKNNLTEIRTITTTDTKGKTTCTEELQKMFNEVNLRNDKSKKRLNNSVEETVYSTDEDDGIEDTIKRRSFPFQSSNARAKILKLDKSLSPEIKISTKTFYSNKKKTTPEKESNMLNLSKTVLQMVQKSSSPKNDQNKAKKGRSKNYSNVITLANKGVGHGIRKHFFKKKQPRKSIDDFLKTIKCEKLKSLPSKRLSLEKVVEVHKILKTTANSIELARPLIIDCEKEISTIFSDSEDNMSDSDVDTISNIENRAILLNIKPSSDTIVAKENVLFSNQGNNVSPTKPKKFFKSGHSSAKQVKITDNIKLGISCGKMSLLSEKRKKHKTQSKMFLNEQAVVNDIIKNLTISPEKNNLSPASSMEYLPINIVPSPKSLSDNELVDTINDIRSVISNSPKSQNDLYANFRIRIPYQTTDPNEIERQNLLLEFLISNNICTEENFVIFIGDPDNHKEEADEIINNMVEVVNDNTYKSVEDINLDPYDHFRNQIPYNTNDPIKAKEQGILLDFLIENNICTVENFTIFIKDLETRKDEAEKIIESVSSLMQIENTPNMEHIPHMETDNLLVKPTEEKSPEKEKLFPIFYSGKKYMPIENKFLRDKKIKNKAKNLWRSAVGQNQYQIDAGQKEFGAKQCPKCGLVYSVHEAEEEIIHKEYHESMHFLKFKGWIDEDVIANYFEWSNDGRIIRVTSSEHTKKKERLMDLLKIVDKELGFASYILPSTYVAFLAARKSQLVGLCLVQFLDKANRYVKINGVDCCTEEKFDAKIGISRIWVSPLCRRMGVATKLLLAARSYSVIGESIDIDKIAFSAPTEDGKIFAQKICKRADFLVYQ